MSTNEPGTPDPNQPQQDGQHDQRQPGEPPSSSDPQRPGVTPEPGVAPQPAPGSGQAPAPQPSPYQPGGAPAPGYPGPPAPGYPGAPGGGYGPPPKNSLGVWSLVLGILSWLVCPIIASIGAIVTGHMSRRAVREGQADNGGLGLAGIILGWASLVLTIVAIIIVVATLNAAVNDPGFQEILDDPSMWATLGSERN